MNVLLQKKDDKDEAFFSKKCGGRKKQLYKDNEFFKMEINIYK
jgi:hypothetical protein